MTEQFAYSRVSFPSWKEYCSVWSSSQYQRGMKIEDKKFIHGPVIYTEYCPLQSFFERYMEIIDAHVLKNTNINFKTAGPI